MSQSVRILLMQHLQTLEQELRRIDAWEAMPPAPERLDSDVPFCHDTLEFTQWTQWVFIPRMRAILEGGHPLPSASAIAPIAEDGLARLERDTDALLALFVEVDALLTGAGNAAGAKRTDRK